MGRHPAEAARTAIRQLTQCGHGGVLVIPMPFEQGEAIVSQLFFFALGELGIDPA